VPMFDIDKKEFSEGINIIELVAGKTNLLASKNEARRTLKENALSINRTKVNEDYICAESDLLNGKYILVQKGKKNYYLIIAK
ncbi:MAG: tyrosine--tRNA ligase, partial [Bacteroidales bacterium]